MSISTYCILWVGVVHVLGVIGRAERDVCVFQAWIGWFIRYFELFERLCFLL